MNELSVACEQLKLAIKKAAQPCTDVAKKWVQMSLTSAQKQKARSK